MLFSKYSALLGLPTFVAAVLAIMTPPMAQAVTLDIGDQKGNAQSVLDASGALQGADYQIKWHQFSSAAPLLEALRADSLDAGGVGNAPLTFAIAGGLHAKVLSSYRSQDLGIVVPQNSSIHSVSQLKGKKIAVARGSVGHLIVLNQLKKAGLSPNDVTFVYLIPSEATLALKQGDVDAIGTWEPYVSFSITKDDTRLIAEQLSHSYVVASDKALLNGEKRKALDDYTQRLAKAREWGNEHPDEYSAVFAKETGLPVDVVQAMLARRKNTPEPITPDVINAQQQVIDTYHDAGLIPQRFDAHSFFKEQASFQHEPE